MNEEQEEYRGEVAKAHFLQKLDSEVWNNTNFPYDWEKYSYGFKKISSTTFTLIFCLICIVQQHRPEGKHEGELG